MWYRPNKGYQNTFSYRMKIQTLIYNLFLKHSFYQNCFALYVYNLIEDIFLRRRSATHTLLFKKAEGNLLITMSEQRTDSSITYYCIKKKLVLYSNNSHVLNGPNPCFNIAIRDSCALINLICGFYCKHSGAVTKCDVSVSNMHGSK